MNENEALNYLGVKSITELDDTIERRIFEIKHEIIGCCHVPKLLISKQQKLKKLNQISHVLKITNEKSDIQIQNIGGFENLNLLESFQIYQKNKSLVLKSIFQSNSIDFLISTIDLLLKNLCFWCNKWPLIELQQEEKIKLSSELDSMNFIRILKELKNDNIISFSQVLEAKLPDELIIEIKRLNLLSKFFDENKF